MKGLSFAVALLCFFGLALLGCSDESSTPVAPADHTVQAPVTLEKYNWTDFTFSHNPVNIIDPGVVKLVRGKWIMKNVGVVEQVVASDPLVSGTMVHYLSGTLAAVTGEGPFHGTLRSAPWRRGKSHALPFTRLFLGLAL